MPTAFLCPVSVDWGDGTIESVQLSASLFFDSGNGIINDFQSLLTGHPEFFGHTYAADGTYTVHVTVGPAGFPPTMIADRTFTVTVGSPALSLRAGPQSSDYSF